VLVVLLGAPSQITWRLLLGVSRGSGHELQATNSIQEACKVLVVLLGAPSLITWWLLLGGPRGSGRERCRPK